MDEGDQKRQLIDEQTEGTGRLRGGVEGVRDGGDAARLPVEESRADSARPRSAAAGARGLRPGIGGARAAVEDTVWFIRRRIAWPIEDAFDRLGRRGAIGVFGGGGIAVAGILAALVIASPGGSGQSATTEALVTPQRTPAPAPAAVRPAPTPKKHVAKPTGPTLHGAPPDFSPAKDVQAGVGDGKALGAKHGGVAGEAAARRGAANGGAADEGDTTATDATASSNDAPASTAKIGATPAATASAQAQASSLAQASDEGAAGSRAGRSAGADAAGNAPGAGTGAGAGGNGVSAGGTGARARGNDADSQPGTNGTRDGFTGAPAPKAAKKVARRFAEAFVVYEVGGIDAKVRKAFNQTSTKQLSRSLLHRPPRQPASVRVPRAKVVNVVAGPSKGRVYTVSVSLLRVGVTSELRLEMEKGVGKKWQVTNVFG